MVTGTDNRHRWLIQQLSRPLPICPTDHPVDFSPFPGRAVIFDVYGTLISSAAGDVGTEDGSGSQAAFEAALRDGGWYITREEMSENGETMLQQAIHESHRNSIELGQKYPEVDIIEIWRGILADLGLSGVEPERLETTAISYECRINPVWPMPGLQLLLEDLAAKSLHMGILSNAQFYTPVLLDTLLEKPLELFDPELIIWSYSEQMGKPCPTLFARMNERLGVQGIPPHEVVYVGNDMYKDIAPAKAAGWHTVLFAGDTRSLRLHQGKPGLESVQPDMVINDISQLTQILR